MKTMGLSCELVTEYAKDLVWEGRDIFDDQLYILAKQNRRLMRLDGKVDWVITDSPILLGAVYGKNKDLPPCFFDLVRNLHWRYETKNFRLERVKPYIPIGRNEDAEGAKEIDLEVGIVLTQNRIPYCDVIGNKDAPDVILKHLGLS